MLVKVAKISGLFLIFLLIAGVSAYLTLTFIIKSEDTIIVPNVVGKDVVATLELLSDLQLNTKVNGSEYSQQFPKNHVTFQEPEAGSEIKRGRDVRIIISKGTRNVLMPNLIAITKHQARMIMEENGILEGQVSHTYSKSIVKDHIIVHVPAAGAIVTRGTAVDILVSLGPRPVQYKMPDLSGLSVEEAMLTIEESNLSVGTISSLFDNDQARNDIVRQEPPAGYPVTEQSPVHLAINRPPRKTAKNRFHRPLYGSLLQHQVESGFLKKNVRVELESPSSSTDIFVDYIKPGEQLWILIPRDQNATVFVFENDKLVKTHIYEAW
jgi:serine/threonine-protein kinase